MAYVTDDYPFAESMVNEHLFIIRADENDMIQKFVFHYLSSALGQELLEAEITGQAQGGLNKKYISRVRIPKPPINIQERIVSEIEQI